MRTRRSNPEIARLAGPLAHLLDGAWKRMHWWVATMAVLYMFSGITVVKSDEVALVLRWGRLVGDIPALQEHGPGLLFALPRPIDQVVRVQVKHVWEARVTDLTINPDDDEDNPGSNTLDPVAEGYALTGDQNVVHVDMVAHYRVRNPAEWAFYGPPLEGILRTEITSAMVRSLGEMGVDRVLADGRKTLIETATRRAQAGLDAAHSGLELTALELVRLSPPAALAMDFDAVQSAFIGAETKKQNAQAYAEMAIPQAQAEADTAVQEAHAAADSDLANAKGESAAFLALEHEYRANPAVVRERLYRDAIDRALSVAGRIRWVPPPIGGNYRGFRVSLRPPSAGPAAQAETQAPAFTPTPGSSPFQPRAFSSQPAGPVPGVPTRPLDSPGEGDDDE